MSVKFSFQATDYQEISGNIFKLFLEIPQSVNFSYLAGQYVNFLLPGENARPFSIANAPDQTMLEFHIRHTPDNAYSQKLINHIKKYQKLAFTGPFGKLAYQTFPRLPSIFMAAGTGFAPCKAIIEQALQDKNHAPIFLYWGARKESDLYFHSELIQLTQANAGFFYFPIVSMDTNSDRMLNHPPERKIRIYYEIIKHHGDFSKFHVYVSGPAEMAFSAQTLFSSKNLNPQQFYSDWLDYPIKGAG